MFLNIPISSVIAINKKFKTTTAVMNLPVSEHLPPNTSTVRRMFTEAKIKSSPRFSAWEISLPPDQVRFIQAGFVVKTWIVIQMPIMQINKCGEASANLNVRIRSIMEQMSLQPRSSNRLMVRPSSRTTILNTDVPMVVMWFCSHTKKIATFLISFHLLNERSEKEKKRRFQPEIKIINDSDLH